MTSIASSHLRMFSLSAVLIFHEYDIDEHEFDERTGTCILYVCTFGHYTTHVTTTDRCVGYLHVCDIRFRSIMIVRYGTCELHDDI